MCMLCGQVLLLMSVIVVNHLIKDKFIIVFEVIVLTILFLLIVFSEVNV